MTFFYYIVQMLCSCLRLLKPIWSKLHCFVAYSPAIEFHVQHFLITWHYTFSLFSASSSSLLLLSSTSRKINGLLYGITMIDCDSSIPESVTRSFLFVLFDIAIHFTLHDFHKITHNRYSCSTRRYVNPSKQNIRC